MNVPAMDFFILQYYGISTCNFLDFAFATFGNFILQQIKHSCQFIRYFAALSLGRIGLGANEVIAGLTKLSADPEIIVADIAKLALKRISLINQYGREIHVAINDIRLYNAPTTDNVNYSLFHYPFFEGHFIGS